MNSALDKWLLQTMFDAIGKPPIRIELWNGVSISPEGREPITTMHFRDRKALLGLAINPELYFGDAYAESRIELDGDLVTALETTYRSMRNAPPAPLRRWLYRLQAKPRRNTLAGSKKNIHRHYDLSNEFYELWLDTEAMQYTCAYYPDPEDDLETGQIAKMDHVCRKLDLKPGDTVVEAGCGWGGLARHMARYYGVTVKSYNISHEQIRYARDKARQLGLEARVEYVEDDYRNIQGAYDVFVSVGMLEHVGKENLKVLGGVVDRSLKEDGRGLIHSIGRNRPTYMNAWIERRIFPGAYPPTLRDAMDIFEPYNFSVLDVENIRLHYAQTLRHWLERFDAHEAEIEKLFDRTFVRAWRLYLAGSVAAFSTGNLQLFQLVFTRARNNRIPWTRAHVYAPLERDEPEQKWITGMS